MPTKQTSCQFSTWILMLFLPIKTECSNCTFSEGWNCRVDETHKSGQQLTGTTRFLIRSVSSTERSGWTNTAWKALVHHRGYLTAWIQLHTHEHTHTHSHSQGPWPSFPLLFPITTANDSWIIKTLSPYLSTLIILSSRTLEHVGVFKHQLHTRLHWIYWLWKDSECRESASYMTYCNAEQLTVTWSHGLKIWACAWTFGGLRFPKGLWNSCCLINVE